LVGVLVSVVVESAAPASPRSVVVVVVAGPPPRRPVVVPAGRLRRKRAVGVVGPEHLGAHRALDAVTEVVGHHTHLPLTGRTGENDRLAGPSGRAVVGPLRRRRWGRLGGRRWRWFGIRERRRLGIRWRLRRRRRGEEDGQATGALDPMADVVRVEFQLGAAVRADDHGHGSAPAEIVH
jgi:hypothetical protein